MSSQISHLQFSAAFLPFHLSSKSPITNFHVFTIVNFTKKKEKTLLTNAAFYVIISFVDELCLSHVEKSPSLVEGARLEIV